MNPLVDEVVAAAFTIPTDGAEADGTISWDATTLVVVQVRAGDVAGTGWTYGPPACAAAVRDLLAAVVTGRPVLDVPATWSAMAAAIRNAGRAGIAGYAFSATDVALWDLKARLLDLPLHRLLGVARDEVPVYGSGGFTTYPDDRLADQLSGWVDQEGVSAVKIKIGQDWGRAEQRDLDRTRFARSVVGDGVQLFVDANGGYRRKQAVRVGRLLEDAGVTWFEEPVSSDDLAGLRGIGRRLDLDVTAGEYGHDAGYFRRMCAAGAVDCLQVDASRCGGVTGWQQAVAIAGAYGLDVSAHCAPALHLPVAAATRNLRHVEWFHDHARVERLALDGVRQPIGGLLRPDPDAPGHGLSIRWADLEPYRVA